MQTSQPPTLPPLDPAVADFLAGLEDTLERARIVSAVPGTSVSIVFKGKIIFAKGFGKRNETEPFTPETLSATASMTKAFTSAAIGELVAEGKMDWDKTPVNKYLPEFELKDPALTAQLTLDDLLSHRTGVPEVDLAWYRPSETRLELIKRLRHVEVKSKLRKEWIYHNILYAVAGEASAQVAGMSYEKLVETRVLRPLGMVKSGFSAMEMKKNDNFAMPTTCATYEDALKGNFEFMPLDEVYMADAPAGDMYSNVIELATWADAVMKKGKLGDRQVLNEASTDTILSAQTIIRSHRRSPDFGISTYGFGWFIDTYKGQQMLHHSGSIPGYRCNIALFPDSELAVIQLANANSSTMPTNIHLYVADHILNLPKTRDWLFDAAVQETKRTFQHEADLLQGEMPEKIKGKPAAHALKDYTGDYDHPLHGLATVRYEVEKDDGAEGENGRLLFKLKTLTSPLEHLHFESFKAVLRDPGFAQGMLIDFQAGTSGEVDGLRLWPEPDEAILFTKLKEKKEELEE